MKALWFSLLVGLAQTSLLPPSQKPTDMVATVIFLKIQPCYAVNGGRNNPVSKCACLKTAMGTDDGSAWRHSAVMEIELFSARMFLIKGTILNQITFARSGSTISRRSERMCRSRSVDVKLFFFFFPDVHINRINTLWESGHSWFHWVMDGWRFGMRQVDLMQVLFELI